LVPENVRKASARSLAVLGSDSTAVAVENVQKAPARSLGTAKTVVKNTG
jgi:hypothetical protein